MNPFMKLPRYQLLVAVLTLGLSPAGADVRWDAVFLETDFANTFKVGDNVTNTPAVALASGGNVAHYPGPNGQLPAASYLENGQTRFIQLRQSVIGHAVAVTPGVVSAMLTKARADLQDAVAYTSFAHETANHDRADGQPWNIRFPGVVNPVNINNSGFTFNDANFLPHLTHTAADHYRAALRVEPFNTNAAHGLLRTYYERMAAFTYAGHNGAERAARVRLLFGDINLEISNLENYTLNFYTNATDELRLLTSRPVEAQLFDGTYPHIPAEPLSPNRNRLTEAFTRALNHQAETVFKLGRLKQFNNYRNPWIDQSAFQNVAGLLAELAAHRRYMAERALLLELAPELTPAGTTELARARYFVDQIERLGSAVENGRIAFVAAHDTGLGSPTQPDIQYVFREYAPDYVPFHALTTVGGVPKRAHEQFLEIASAGPESFLGRALSREASVNHLNRDFDVSQFAHTQSLNEITNRYFGELGTLCGRIRTGSGELVPDIILALLPRSERRAIHTYGGSGESEGEIGTQWGRVESVQTELEIAQQDLAALYSQMEMKSFVSGEIVSGLSNVMNLTLENGEKLAAMDREAGEIQAKATIDAEAASRRGSLFGKIVGSVVKIGMRVVAAYFTGGTSEIAMQAAEGAKLALKGDVADSLVGIASAWQQGRNSKDAAQIQAKAQRKLAEINAKRTQIATLERAAVQHQQIQSQLLLTAEAMHALRLQAARQELAILLAEQRLANEFLALANLESRVQYLLQEYAGALALQNSNPLSSPDYRLVRDLKLREAEDAFHLAHRWVYLAGKSVEYRVNTADEATTLPNTIANILRARNASSLEMATANLNNLLNSFYQDQNREVSGLTPNYISFRHHIIQRNTLTNEQDIAVAELQPANLSSAEHWLQFLLAQTVTNASGVRQRLVIPFSTSLDRWPQSPDPRFKNPLFGNDTHNDAISGPGIELQFLGTGLSLGGLTPRFRLEYLGASVMRQELCAVTGGKRVRHWNIRRPDGSPYLAEGIPGIATAASWGTGATGFNEFSPANDRWQLIIDGTQGQGAAANAEILNQLHQVTDIRIRFWTSYFPSASCP